MKQYEAVIKVMEQNGGYATLGLLYQKVLKLRGYKWRTKTPDASIRRIVQDERFFFKIKPGLWALKSHKKLLPPEMLPSKRETQEQQEFNHSYYQGLLVQIGNLQNYETFIPTRDKEQRFLERKKLGNLATLEKLYPFSYPHIVKRARTIDVVWFNSRKMPASIFEVEHTTRIKNSLIKFVELQDFRTDMVIVAKERLENYFQKVLSFSAFQPIKRCVKFLSYQQLADYHSNLYRLKSIQAKTHLTAW